MKLRPPALFAAVLLLLGAACAPQQRPATPPAPRPAGRVPTSRIPRPTPPRLLPAFVADSAAMAIAAAVPPFEAGPLITWGPLPPGTEHTERVRSFDLQHQVVNVKFDWKRHRVIGTTSITIAALDSALRTVELDAVGMIFTRVAATNTPPLRYDYDGRKLRIPLPTPLAPGARTSISIEYETTGPKKGLYFIDRKRVVWTQGETEDTRYWVPTYDYPNDKTTWEMFITTAPGERALSNGRLAGYRSVPGGTEWHWVQDKPASTYLMSIVTGNYTVVKDSWRGVPVEYYTYPDSVEAARRGFAVTPAAMEVFSQKTGVQYPWAKYDQSVVPDFTYGGMENVSATTQNDNGILHPAWAEPERNAAGLVAHELGHQWYGDLLTTQNWANIWLNEGFATFMEQTFREANMGADEAAIVRLGAQQQTIEADRRARRPIVYSRWQNDPIELFFSGHIYPKGATILQMLRRQLGDSLFWRAMNRYTTQNAYRNVVSDDLRRAFEETTGRDFKPFFAQWVYGAGLPAFQVAASYDPRSKRVTFRATEVQPRDSLTGYFDADVDVEVTTDVGRVRGVVPVRNGVGQATLAVPSAPRAMRWDEGGWLLDVVDFPRSTLMLAYQLASEDDVIGRLEAVDLLRRRARDVIAVSAVSQAARQDSFWAVRASAAAALASFQPDSVVPTGAQLARDALMAALRDRDPRVRGAAITAATRFAGPVVTNRLREMATSDSSLIVRGRALAADLTIERDAALAFADQIMARPSWADVLRTPALAVLKAMGTPSADALYRKYAPRPPRLPAPGE